MGHVDKRGDHKIGKLNLARSHGPPDNAHLKMVSLWDYKTFMSSFIVVGESTHARIRAHYNVLAELSRAYTHSL